jgi:hypothetical protein
MPTLGVTRPLLWDDCILLQWIIIEQISPPPCAAWHIALKRRTIQWFRVWGGINRHNIWRSVEMNANLRCHSTLTLGWLYSSPMDYRALWYDNRALTNNTLFSIIEQISPPPCAAWHIALKRRTWSRTECCWWGLCCHIPEGSNCEDQQANHTSILIDGNAFYPYKLYIYTASFSSQRSL